MLHFNKNLVCVCLLLALGLGELKAQSKESTIKSAIKSIRFGAVAGYANVAVSSKITTTTTVTLLGDTSSTSSTAESSESGSGFFVGGFAEKSFTKNIGLQLGLNYQNIKAGGDDLSSLNISLLGGYYFYNLFKRDKRFSVELGFNYDLQFSEGSVSGIGLITGVGYDITDKIFTNIRYIPTFTNRLETKKVGSVETKGDMNFYFLQVGVGYRF